MKLCAWTAVAAIVSAAEVVGAWAVANRRCRCSAAWRVVEHHCSGAVGLRKGSEAGTGSRRNYALIVGLLLQLLFACCGVFRRSGRRGIVCFSDEDDRVSLGVKPDMTTICEHHWDINLRIAGAGVFATWDRHHCLALPSESSGMNSVSH